MSSDWYQSTEGTVTQCKSRSLELTRVASEVQVMEAAILVKKKRKLQSWIPKWFSILLTVNVVIIEISLKHQDKDKMYEIRKQALKNR